MKKEKEQQKENRIEVKHTIDSYRDARASQIAQVIAEIGNVGHLTADELVSISRRLFKLVSFCDCIRTENGHNCGKFNYHDHEHLPYCRCCQTLAFGYYLAWCLDRLSQENRLPEFDNARFTIAKIRDRTYGYTKSGSKIYFRIWRHLNAFHLWRPQETVLQEWVFDVEKLTLIESEYI